MKPIYIMRCAVALALVTYACDRHATGQELAEVDQSEFADFVDQELQAFVTERAQKLEELEEALRAAKAGRVSRLAEKETEVLKVRSGVRLIYSSPEAKEELVKSLEKELAKLDISKNSLVLSVLPSLPWTSKMKVGQVGALPKDYLSGSPLSRVQLPPIFTKSNDSQYQSLPSPPGWYSYRVVQVVDKNNALINRNYSKDGDLRPSGGVAGARLVQGPSVSSDMLFWYRGPTEGMATNASVDMPGTYKVTEIKKYDATVGTNSVFVVESIDLTQIIDQKYNKYFGEPKPEFRTWTDATGQFTVEAKFLSMKNGVVTIGQKNGKTVDLPLAKLSVSDQQYIDSNYSDD